MGHSWNSPAKVLSLAYLKSGIIHVFKKFSSQKISCKKCFLWLKCTPTINPADETVLFRSIDEMTIHMSVQQWYRRLFPQSLLTYVWTLHQWYYYIRWCVIKIKCNNTNYICNAINIFMWYSSIGFEHYIKWDVNITCFMNGTNQSCMIMIWYLRCHNNMCLMFITFKEKFNDLIGFF